MPNTPNTTDTNPTRRRGGLGSPLHSAYEREVINKLTDEEIEDAPKKVDSHNRSKIKHRLQRQIANDIYPLPEVVNPSRREMCRTSLIRHAETYYPARFYLRWSKTHYQLMEKLERAVLDKQSDLLAFAMPRGSGKSTISLTTLEWALYHGHVRYGLLVNASGKLAYYALTNFKDTVLTNHLLYEDFPEICYPLRMSGGQSIKCKNQHLEGTPTNVTWGADKVSLPRIDDSPSSGSVIQCTSITSSMRGLFHAFPDGSLVRPQFVILDDVQNDRSAKNANTVAGIENKINGAVKGLAGPGEPITMIMPCTVIRKDDVAERFLDREKRPQWQGIRTKLLESFPSNMELWNKYNDIRMESFRAGNKGREATEYYRQNRVAMDEGANAPWEERYNANSVGGTQAELSAIQHAMNLYFDDPSTFASEYQNEPLQDLIESKPRLVLEAKALMDRISGHSRFVVPSSTLAITTGVDIQGKILYYVSTAWTEDFGGIVVDAGTYPEQPNDYFTAQEPPLPMDKVEGNEGMLTAPLVYRGLDYLKEYVFSRQYLRENTEEKLSLSRVFIDMNWAVSIDAVFAFCKAQEPGEIYFPASGRGIGPDNLPMDLWPRVPGEIKGKNWIRKAKTRDTNRGRHYTFDTNFWKSTIAERLLVHMGTSNALMFYGNTESRMRYQQLRLLCDHFASEGMVRKPGRGRDVDVWGQKPGSENHFWDCLIMSAVAASSMGVPLHEMITNGSTSAIPRPQRRVAAPPPKPTERI